MTLKQSDGEAPILEICVVWWPSQLGVQDTPLQRGKTPPSKECPIMTLKQSDGEVSVMLELWGMQSTPSLPSLPGPLWPGVVAPDGQIELFNI